MRARRRFPPRLVCGTLLATILASSTALHRHAVVDDEAVGKKASESVVTSHNPLSSGPHCHAVLRIVQENACWGCRWQRHFGLSAPAAISLPVLQGRALVALPHRAAVSVGRYSRLSRAPPSLL
ncbi:MAG TPA: hypothetical protein VGL03_00970 [Thermoanaerobaculia bacterium]